MFSLRTTTAWDLGTFTVDFGAAAQVFTPTSTDDSAYAVLVLFQAWIAANFPGESMTWAWTADAATSGASVAMTFSNATTIVSDAAAQSWSGLPGSSGPALTHTSTWEGTWAPTSQLDLTRYVRHLGGEGHASGVGALRRGVPGTSHRIPLLRAVGTSQDVGRLISILIDAARPREAWVYQVHTDTWILLTVGRVTHGRGGPLLNMMELEVLG